jgi:hypothetical protein
MRRLVRIERGKACGEAAAEEPARANAASPPSEHPEGPQGHHSTPMSLALARSFSVALFNWPQAAMISRPRGVRTGLA